MGSLNHARVFFQAFENDVKVWRELSGATSVADLDYADTSNTGALGAPAYVTYQVTETSPARTTLISAFAAPAAGACHFNFVVTQVG